VERDRSVSYEMTGTTAFDIDMTQKGQSASVPCVALVVVLALLLLLVGFCSIWVQPASATEHQRSPEPSHRRPYRRMIITPDVSVPPGRAPSSRSQPLRHRPPGT
jgi:hypothetical protein